MSDYSKFNKKKNSVGIVKKKHVVFSDKIKFESGMLFGPISIAYETYGTLNSDKSNAILILHALTGDSHVAGYYDEKDIKPGWWEFMTGPLKGIDTDKYFVICSNIIGGCMGSTGPSSIDPETSGHYATKFPLVTLGDMVTAQKKLIDYLGIKKLMAVVGGSLGGMQALTWCVKYPKMVVSAILLATTARHSALAIAFNEVARQAIMADPHWNNGYYYSKKKPNAGLAVARMIGHITYLSDESMRKKFGRRLQDKNNVSFNFNTDFQIENYLHYQGKKFVERFDANSFLYITKAADYFDLAKEYGNDSLVMAFSKALAKFLVISFTSDWLYPTYQSKLMVKAMKKSGLDVSFCEIKAGWGHDAFLLPSERFIEMVKNFLNNTYKEI
jgi:homoserine O-acetyltransferase